MLVVLLAARPALADAARHDLLVEYTRIARGAAMGGNCDIARQLAEKVRQLDPSYYAKAFAADSVIASCLVTPGSVEPAPTPPPPTLPSRDVDELRPLPAPPIVRPDVPPLSFGRVAGEVLVGGLGGLGGLAIGLFAGSAICLDKSGEFSCLGSAVIGGLIGGAFGLSAGVYVVGATNEQTGSLAATLLGTVIGGGLAIGIASYDGVDDELAIFSAIVLPMTGAVVAFNSTRRWVHTTPRPSPPMGSLLTFDGERTAVGIPMVVRGNNARGAPTSISLLGGTF